MKAIRKITRNGNATTVSIHPAMMLFLQWRPGDHVVMEVISHEELRIHLPTERDLRAPIETSVLSLAPPLEVKA